MAGQSEESDPGNGAVILNLADAPVNLANVAAVTSATQVGLTWSEGPGNGGQIVLDYTVSYGLDTGSYLYEIGGVVGTTLTVTEHLTTGLTYKFKVKARNDGGFSPDSSAVMILVAQKPDTPVAPTTSIDDSNVLIEWTPPYDQGDALQGFQIFILQ